MTEAEARNHATFTALMWALSYPGRPQSLPARGLGALAAIGAALLDLETSYYTPDAELDGLLARTGARRARASEARYQLFPSLGPAELDALAAAPVGSYAYPDESATVVLGCRRAPRCGWPVCRPACGGCGPRRCATRSAGTCCWCPATRWWACRERRW
jgi:alpha-D-ribose 1-methylphosphonate 5-triphosphate synthase subunit PhnH